MKVPLLLRWETACALLAPAAFGVLYGIDPPYLRLFFKSSARTEMERIVLLVFVIFFYAASTAFFFFGGYFRRRKEAGFGFCLFAGLALLALTLTFILLGPAFLQLMDNFSDRPA